MYFINKADIQFYRYAIAKECFLRLYTDYILIENIVKSNCMKMKKIKDDKEIIVSLFGKPDIKVKKNKIEIFYQSIHFNKAYKKNKDKNISVLKFSNEFNEKYDEAFKYAIRFPQKYIDSIEKNVFLFEGILIMHKDADDFDIKYYKYYSDATVNVNKYKVVDGDVSFVNPNKFNDPFDVNCSFFNGDDLSKMFRILCVAPSPLEILMWSYYGNDHKGYCFEYNAKDILNKILEDTIDGLCIIGNVDYKKERPKQKSQLNAISITEVNFYIQAAFTKFEEWKHEKEYRFVLLSNSFDCANGDYKTINIPIYNVYSGIRNSNTSISGSTNTITTKKIYKHNTEYLLK